MGMEPVIGFGPEGWRGRFGSAVSFASLRRYLRGYVRYLRGQLPVAGEKKVILSYDSNLISKKFAREAARILSINRIWVLMPERDLPLSAVSLHIVQNRLTGGLDFRKECKRMNCYQFRILNGAGQLAMPSETARIEWEIRQIPPDGTALEYPETRLIAPCDPIGEFLDFLLEKVDGNLLKKASGKLILDSMFGSSRDILERVFFRLGMRFISIHNFDDPSWGGLVPVIDRRNLKELSREVVQHAMPFGIAIDKDCFEIALLDGAGRMIDGNKLQLAVMEYLINRRKCPGGIVRSAEAGLNIDRLARIFEIPLIEVFPGSKYLSQQLGYSPAFVAVDNTQSLIFDTPTRMRNGILYALFLIEMLAFHDFQLDRILPPGRYPRVYRKKVGMDVTPALHKRYRRILRSDGGIFPAGKRPETVSRLDGITYHFSDGRLRIRENPESGKIEVAAQSWDSKRTGELIENGQILFH